MVKVPTQSPEASEAYPTIVCDIASVMGGKGVVPVERELLERAISIVLPPSRLSYLHDRKLKVLTGREERAILVRATCLSLVAGNRPSKTDLGLWRGSAIAVSGNVAMSLIGATVGTFILVNGILDLLHPSMFLVGAALSMVGSGLVVWMSWQLPILYRNASMTWKLVPVLRAVHGGQNARDMLTESGDFR